VADGRTRGRLCYGDPAPAWNQTGSTGCASGAVYQTSAFHVLTAEEGAAREVAPSMLAMCPAMPNTQREAMLTEMEGAEAALALAGIRHGRR